MVVKAVHIHISFTSLSVKSDVESVIKASYWWYSERDMHFDIPLVMAFRINYNTTHQNELNISVCKVQLHTINYEHVVYIA